MTSDTIITKICTSCQIAQALDHYNRAVKGKFGRAAKCKACMKKRDSKFYEENKEKILSRCADYRERNKEECVARSMVSRKKKPDYYRQYNRELRKNNHDHYVERDKKWRDENREHIRALASENYHNNGGKEKQQLYKETNKAKLTKRDKQYYLENKEAYAERAKQRDPEKLKQYGKEYRINNPDKRKESVRNWSQKNPDKVRASVNKRRVARIRATSVNLTMEQKVEIEELYQQAIKLEELTGIRFEVDHIVPLQPENKDYYGLHAPQNLRIITMTENRRKANR